MKEEAEVQVKNAELTLLSIREDTLKEAALLTKIIESKDEWLKYVADTEARIAKEKLDLISFLAEEKRDAAQQKRDSQHAVLRGREELKVLNEQKRQAMKELANLNDWNLKAGEEQKQLDAHVGVLRAEKAEIGHVSKDLKDLKDAKETAELSIAQMGLESTLMMDEAQGKLLALEDKYKEIEQKVVDSDMALEASKIALYDMQNEEKRIRKDVDIYVARARVKYEEMFPGLKMNL